MTNHINRLVKKKLLIRYEAWWSDDWKHMREREAWDVQKLFLLGIGDDEVGEIAEVELQDLKEAVRMKIKSEATIFLTLTATFLSLGLWGSTKVLSKEESL